MKGLAAKLAKKADRAFILRAHDEIARLSGQPDHGDKWVEDILGAKPKAWAMVAKLNNKPVGMVLFSPTYFAGDGQVVWVSQLFVEPKHRAVTLPVIGVMLRGLQKLHPEAIGYCWATSKKNKWATKFFMSCRAKALPEYTMFYRKYIK